MRYACLGVGVLALLVGTLMVTAAKSAIHEIEAGISFLIFATMFGAAGIISVLERYGKDQVELLRLLAGIPRGWTCPTCRTTNPIGKAVCAGCGHAIT